MRRGWKEGRHQSWSLLPEAGIGGQGPGRFCQAMLKALWVGRGRRWARPGPLPWTEQAGLAGLIAGSGKAFLPGWPGIQAQTKGGFLSRLFVLLPQSAALCMAKANSTLQLGNLLWGLPGLVSELPLLSSPSSCPAASALGVSGCLCPPPQGVCPPASPRQGLRPGQGHLGQAAAALKPGRVEASVLLGRELQGESQGGGGRRGSLGKRLG